MSQTAVYLESPSATPPAAANHTRLLLTPADAWEAMYADCLAAQKSIHFEQYIIANDSIGLRFLALFIEKAKSGVKVQLVLDSIGSHDLENSDTLKQLQDAGGEVIIFNHKNLLDILFPATWLPRNHAKTMIIDSAIAYVGSVCLAEYMSHWRDMHARLTGSIVASIQKDFTDFWEHLRANTSRRRISRLHSTLQASSSDGLRYVVHKPELHTNALYKELLAKIAGAKEQIILVTPYFLPPRRLRLALAAARRRGVHITVLLSEATDVPIADRVGRSYFPTLLRLGIGLQLYTSSVMHAKYSIIDGNWATIGSTNLDYLSLLYNRETNLVIEDRGIIDRLRQQFQADYAAGTRASLDSWKKMPFLYRLTGRCGRFLRHMM